MLFLQAQGLLDDPHRAATPASLARLIDRLGYVQVDSINRVDRGHHLTLGARLYGYQPRHLHHLLVKRRSLFEHFTHDSSVIPTRWFGHWKLRFQVIRKRMDARPYWRKILGGRRQAVLEHVLGRIRQEGPLMSRDFETRERVDGHWWGVDTRCVIDWPMRAAITQGARASVTSPWPLTAAARISAAKTGRLS